MNKLYCFICFVLFIVACADDPEFPDPGFDMMIDKNFTVRRDTTESFMLRLNVKAPGGVNTIQILEGRTYKVLEELTQYRGQEDFTLRHELSFDKIDKNRDSVLIYMVRVVTNDNRAFNSSFKVNLLKLSFPEITLVNNEVVGTTLPVVGINGSVSCGIYKLASVKIYIENQEQYSVPAAEIAGLSEYGLAVNIPYNFETGHDYNLRVEVQDERGEKREKTITVKGIELKKPKSIMMDRDGDYKGIIDITYDEKQRVVKMICDDNFIPGESYTITCNYNADGTVRLLECWYHKTAGDKSYLDFTYEGGRLVKALHGRYPLADPENISVFETFQNIRYREDNTISSFDVGINTIHEVQYVDGFIPGERICAEKWGKLVGDLPIGERKVKAGFVPVAMPLHIEGMPPICLLRWVGAELSDLCGYKYVYTSEAPGYGNTQAPTTYFRKYTYTCDEYGQLRTLTNKDYPVGWWITYTFNY